MKYFQFLPKIEYSKKTATNIIVRSKIRELVKNDIKIVYPYIVKDGERPDTISHKYYGSVNFTWLVYYSNNIFDPVFDWVLDSRSFSLFIRKKYGSIAAAKSQIYNLYNIEGQILDETSWLEIPEVDRRILYNYDYEFIKNEKKREILLVDNSYTQQLNEELKALFR